MNNSLRIFRSIAVASMLLAPAAMTYGQGGCFEIKSILVDACGTPEGENEMVRFDVGASALNTTNMSVDWPNNNWLGLCQDASTAANVNTINQGIQGCGYLMEPVGGNLPANSKVLMCTSVNVNSLANSFSNLNDTIVIIFQCAGNTSGHFANYNTLPGLRTLSITFAGGNGCTDSVTYDRTLLVNQFGQIGGFSFENDGAFVEFTAAGNPTYLNNGCQVLSTGLNISAGPDIGICPGGSNIANLSGTAVNNIGNVQWSGGTGSFSAPNSTTTTYTPGPGETGIVYLTLTGNGACSATETDTVRVNIVPSLPTPNVTASVQGVFYSSVTDPQYFYNWYPDGSTTAIPGAFNPTFTPNTNGCYYMILSTVGGCTVTSNTVCITNVGLNDLSANTTMSIINSPGHTPWVRVNTQNSAGEVTLQITDLSGRLITQQSITATGTSFEIHPDWSNIANGMYILKLTNGNWKVEGKALITK